MEITLRFFASLRDIAGISECTLQVPSDTTLTQMIEQLVTCYPALDGHQESWHFAVNQTHAEPDTVLQPDDQVAVFPYVAGG